MIYRVRRGVVRARPGHLENVSVISVNAEPAASLVHHPDHALLHKLVLKHKVQTQKLVSHAGL